MKAALKALWNDEQGQGLTEYALLIALVSLGLIRNARNVLNSNSSVPQESAP
jgi:Flp pilus assembly pilin Flp